MSDPAAKKPRNQDVEQESPLQLTHKLIQCLVQAAVTSYGFTAASRVAASPNILNSFLETLITLALVTIVYWYSLGSIKSVMVRRWIKFVYEPITMGLMYVVVRTGTELFFDGSGEFAINKFIEPIVFISLVGLVYTVLRSRQESDKDLS
jgi:hypothetical protein